MGKDYRKTIDRLLTDLEDLDLFKIILFGSFTEDSMEEQSDIDLLVILDSDSISRTYEEKMKNKLLVRNRILDINKKFPIDLLVYTKAEYGIILENMNSFFKEIHANGRVLYEKAS